jgi:hypothetical protein
VGAPRAAALRSHRKKKKNTFLHLIIIRSEAELGGLSGPCHEGDEELNAQRSERTDGQCRFTACTGWAGKGTTPTWINALNDDIQ